jgi:hypothetical protein
MSDRFVFQIRALSIEEGFELNCDAIMDQPIRVERLFEAVVLATQLGQDSSIEIQILDVGGATAEVIALSKPRPASGLAKAQALRR